MRRIFLWIALALLITPTWAEGFSPFGWQFEKLVTRGGTSRGGPVTLAPAPSESWRELQRAGLEEKQRDRLAILAMAGEYRASFDFIEVAGFVANHKPRQPYRSWGTEKVFVLEDSPNRIVLQHILVMKIAGEPARVVKHWRQDWDYEPDSVLRFKGLDVWRLEPVTGNKGMWSQSVYQVDDSPRYGGVGKWVHEPGYSAWESDYTWRPLPRREYSVRSDYQVLAGVNRHIITPNGWTHEQENNKLVLNDERAVERVIARELGLNRYERLVDFDFSAGDEYFKATEQFWGKVRRNWATLLDSQESLQLKGRAGRGQLIGRSFGMALSEVSDSEVERLVRDYLR